MCKYVETKYMQIYFAHLLITLNVPLRIDKCTTGGTCTPGWEPLFPSLICCWVMAGQSLP